MGNFRSNNRERSGRSDNRRFGDRDRGSSRDYGRGGRDGGRGQHDGDGRGGR